MSFATAFHGLRAPKSEHINVTEVEHWRDRARRSPRCLEVAVFVISASGGRGGEAETSLDTAIEDHEIFWVWIASLLSAIT